MKSRTPPPPPSSPAFDSEQLESDLESKTRETGVVELALVASKVDAEELTRDRARLRERAEELEGERAARLTQARKAKHDKKKKEIKMAKNNN